MELFFNKEAKLKKRNEREKKGLALQKMKDFAEGKIETEDFWNQFQENAAIQDILVSDKTRPSYSKDLYYAPERILDVYNPLKIQDRAELYDMVKKYFMRNKIKCNFKNKDSDMWNYLQTIQPKWIYIYDEEFLFKTLDCKPNDLTEQNKTLYESKLLDMFKYNQAPPEWLQNPEWPIVDGKPLIFKEMLEKIEGDVITDEYIFYDEETKEEVRVIQSDFQ